MRRALSEADYNLARATLQKTTGVISETTFRELHRGCGNLSEEEVKRRLGEVKMVEDENGRLAAQEVIGIYVLACQGHSVRSAEFERFVDYKDL